MVARKIVKIGDGDDAILSRPVARVRDFGPRLHKLLD